MAIFMENFRKHQNATANEYAALVELNPTQEAILISETICTFRDLKNNCVDQLINLDAKFKGDESSELISEGVKESFANMIDFMIRSVKKFIDFIVSFVVKLVKGSTAKMQKNLVAKIKAVKEKTLDEGKTVPDSMKAKVFTDNRYPAILIATAMTTLSTEKGADEVVNIKIGDMSPSEFLEALKTYTEGYNEETKSIIDITTTKIGAAIKAPGAMWKKENQNEIIQDIIKEYLDAFATTASDDSFKVTSKDDVKKEFYDKVFGAKKELTGNALRDAIKAQVAKLEEQVEFFNTDTIVKNLEKDKEMYTGLAKSLEKAVKEARKKASGVATKEEKADEVGTMSLLAALGKIVGTYGAAMVQVYAIYDITLRDAMSDAEKVLDIYEKMVALKDDKKADKKEEDKK